MLTLRVTVHGLPSGDGPRVLAFFHGQQMSLLSARDTEPYALLVSWSRDGDLQTSVMTALGLHVERGSSSRHGARGLLGLVRQLRLGRSVAVAVDGPRGPFGVARPGAAFAARAAGAPLHPVGSACRRSLVLESAWDRFEIPMPFTRVAIVVGAPIPAALAVERPEVVSRAIEEARDLAEARLCRTRAPVGLASGGA